MRRRLIRNGRVVDEFFDLVDLDLLELACEQQRRDAEQLRRAARVGSPVQLRGGAGWRRLKPLDLVQNGDREVHRTVALAELGGAFE